MELRGQFNLHLEPAQMSIDCGRLRKTLLGGSVVPILFAVYLVPRVAILFLDVEPQSDAGWYVNRAVALSAGEGYSERGILTAYWPPGWSFTLALFFKIFGPSLYIVKMINLACSVVAGWFTLDLGRRLFKSELAGRLALLTLAIYPNSIGYIPSAMTEVFYTTLFLALLWMIVVPRTNFRFLAAGLVLGVATLVKSQSLAVLPFIFLIAILRQPLTLKRISAALFGVGLVGATACLVIAPWIVRNYAVFNQWVFISTNGGLTLLTGNNPSARGDYTPDDPLVTSIDRNVSNQVEVDKEARRRALEWIKENPGRFVLLIPMKWFRLWAPDGESEWWFQGGFKAYEEYAFYFRLVRYLNQAIYMLLLLAFAWSGLLLFSGRVKISESLLDWWALPYAIAVYLTVLAIVFPGQSRFHYPAMPLIIMCAAWLVASTVLAEDKTGSNPDFKRALCATGE
jgi:4-amino-4-deoxy-L-arabinose transferase-like glycosyltransferase